MSAHRKLILGIAAIICAASVIAGFLYFKYQQDLAQAKEIFRYKSSQSAKAVAGNVDQSFQQIYQNLRTISYLPSVRKIDRHGENLDGDGRATIQQIYNNIKTNVAVSEVYIVPASLDPERIDPVTGKPEAPILMFDKAIFGDASEAPAAGQRFRVNFYRMQGPPPGRKMIAWQPTHQKNYHVPEAFGLLELK